jgi:hypothetical protein
MAQPGREIEPRKQGRWMKRKKPGPAKAEPG